MKRERYFRDELWRMFAIYAILPAVLFTFFCGILFMAVLLHGRERANRDYLAYVTGRVKQTVESCEQGIETLRQYRAQVMYWSETAFSRSFMGSLNRRDMNRNCI